MAEGKFAGWQAFAAVLGAVATLLTACIAAAAFFLTRGGEPEAEQPGVRQPQARQDATGTAASAPGTGGPEAPLYQGPLRLEATVEFDVDPPDNNPIGGSQDLYVAGGADSNKINGYYGAAKWSGATAPTRAQCDQELRVGSTRDSITVDVGNLVCLRTSGGRTVLLRFVKQGTDRKWSLDVTVWPA